MRSSTKQYCIYGAATLSLLFAREALGGDSFVYRCHVIGVPQVESLGDKDGHSLSMAQHTCLAEGGPFDGAIMTGSNIQEYNGPNGIGRAGSGVVRKPGVTAIYVTTEQKTVLKVADGRVVGFESNTKGRYVMATGTAAAYAGKSYSSTARSTAPGQFVIEVKFD